MSNQWLVTGAQGFIGRYASAYILNSDPGAKVLGVGRSKELEGIFSHSISTKPGSAPAPLPPSISNPLDRVRYRYVQADVQDALAIRSLVRSVRPNIILHLASGLRGDERSRLIRTNIEGVGILLEALLAEAPDVSAFVLGSSGGVYGALREHQLPLKESERCSPDDEYSVSKLAAEHLARVLTAGSSVRLVIARIFNVIGAGQDERHIGARFASQLARVMYGADEEVRVGRLDPTRDFIDVTDVASAMVKLARNPEAHGVFNIASGREVAIRELCEYFLRLSGANATLVSLPALKPGVLRNCGSIERLREHGIAPVISLETSVTSVLEYYRAVWM